MTMKTTETIVWMALFWALYAPTTLILHAITLQGSLAGIFAIGGALSVLLGVVTKTQNGVIFDDVEKITKLEVYHDKTEKQEARTSAPSEGGFESGVPMRTDVDLCRLDVDDDSDVSDGSGRTAH